MRYTGYHDIRYTSTFWISPVGEARREPEGRPQRLPNRARPDHRIRASSRAIDLPHVHMAVTHRQQLAHLLDLHAPSRQRFAYEPISLVPIQTSVIVQRTYRAARGILPSWRPPLISPGADPISFRRTLHPQRFVRSQLVVHAAKFLQRRIPLR